MRSSANRLTGLIFGAFFIAVGIFGFIVTATGGVGFFSTDGGLILGIFEVNIAHNLAHLLLGVVLAAAALGGVRSAKVVNTVIGTAYLLLGIAGLFLVSNSGLNILAVNAPDNVLHFASAVVLLGVGLGAERDVVTPVT
jgi:hypothetical protein